MGYDARGSTGPVSSDSTSRRPQDAAAPKKFVLRLCHSQEGGGVTTSTTLFFSPA